MSIIGDAKSESFMSICRNVSKLTFESLIIFIKPHLHLHEYFRLKKKNEETLNWF